MMAAFYPPIKEKFEHHHLAIRSILGSKVRPLNHGGILRNVQATLEAAAA